MLLAARAVQGVGAAMLMPNSLSILSHAFAGEAKGRAVGTWAAVGAIAAAVGPPLGGWLVDAVGWRAIFYINLPVAAAAVALALTAVEESGTGERPLDWTGAVLATAALGALTWALTLWSSQRVMAMPAWIALGVGIVTLALFVILEHRRGGNAMMPLDLFAGRAFVGLTAYTFLLYGALGGLIVLLPYVLIQAEGYSPLQAGLALLPFSIAIGAGSRVMGGLTERIGPRWPLTIGPSVVAGGFAALLLVGDGGSYWTSVLPGMILIAGGMACAVAPLTTAVLSTVDDDHAGTASGFNSAIARTGGLIATAGSGAVIAAGGADLIAAFRVAALAGSALAVGAAVSAFASLGEATK